MVQSHYSELDLWDAFHCAEPTDYLIHIIAWPLGCAPNGRHLFTKLKAQQVKAKVLCKPIYRLFILLLFTKFLSDGTWWTSWFLQSRGSTKDEIHLPCFIPLALTKQLMVELAVIQLQLERVCRFQGLFFLFFHFWIILSRPLDAATYKEMLACLGFSARFSRLLP